MVGGVIVDVLILDVVARVRPRTSHRADSCACRACGSGGPASWASLRTGEAAAGRTAARNTLTCLTCAACAARPASSTSTGNGTCSSATNAAAYLALPGSDRDDLAAEGLDLVVALAQLRGVLAAEQSAEVSEEDQDHRPLGPEVAEPRRASPSNRRASRRPAPVRSTARTGAHALSDNDAMAARMGA